MSKNMHDVTGIVVPEKELFSSILIEKVLFSATGSDPTFW